ncbi:MAG: ABC transporter substrate-binding protein [Thermomicrobiales bacterium]
MTDTKQARTTQAMLTRNASRRDLLRGAAALGASAIPMATVATASAVRPGLAQGVPEGEIIIGLQADINTLDPHLTTTVGTDLSVISHLYTSLVLRGPDMQLQPALATAWQATSDTTWQFSLRADITFPNGEKLDATAVKWNVDRVLNPDTQARVAPWFATVAEVRVIDPTTVEIVTKSPFPALVEQLSMFFLLPPRWASEHNPASEALGSGPYDLVEWVKDDHVTLKAKTQYWGAAPPYETATFRAVPEPSSRVSGLLAGDYDVVIGIPPTDFERINDAGSATAGSVASTRTAMVKINTAKPPFDNQQVRQALNYAVDKQGLIDALLTGLDVVPSQGQVLTEQYFGFNPDLEPYPYDVDKAKQLVEDAGITGDIEATLDVPTGTYLLGSEISQAVAGQLEEIGVKAQISEKPFSVYMDQYLKGHSLGELFYITQAWPTLDADGLLTLFASDSQYAYWDNPDFSQLLAEARLTLDQAQRQELYKQATAIMREDAPSIFLFPQPATYAVANSVQWQARPDDWVHVWEMTSAG